MPSGVAVGKVALTRAVVAVADGAATVALAVPVARGVAVRVAVGAAPDGWSPPPD